MLFCYFKIVDDYNYIVFYTSTANLFRCALNYETLALQKNRMERIPTTTVQVIVAAYIFTNLIMSYYVEHHLVNAYSVITVFE